MKDVPLHDFALYSNSDIKTSLLEYGNGDFVTVKANEPLLRPLPYVDHRSIPNTPYMPDISRNSLSGAATRVSSAAALH